MLEKVDLNVKMEKEVFTEKMEILHPHLYDLQQRLRKAEIPAIIVFEGWDAAGKGTCISSFLEWLDPRWFKVSATYAPRPDQKLRPWLWRFWEKIPNYGEITIFDRSWYGRVLVEHIDGLVTKEQYERAFIEIRQFEGQLANDRYIVLKFWLHISKKEQKKRFKSFEDDPLESWKVTEQDWRNHKLYDVYAEAIENMLAETSTTLAPWTIVEATCLRFARVKIAENIIAALESKLKEKGAEYITLEEHKQMILDKEAAEK